MVWKKGGEVGEDAMNKIFNPPNPEDVEKYRKLHVDLSYQLRATKDDEVRLIHSKKDTQKEYGVSSPYDNRGERNRRSRSRSPGFRRQKSRSRSPYQSSSGQRQRSRSRSPGCQRGSFARGRNSSGEGRKRQRSTERGRG